MAKKIAARPRGKKTPQSNSKIAKVEDKHRKHWLFALLGVLVLTYIIYTPALKNSITGWDDKNYITLNKLIQKLDGETVSNIFSFNKGIYFGNYHPLTFLSYAIEYHYSKLEPRLYHTVNIWLHLINVVLVFLFVKMLTRNNYLVAFITSLLFAVHPMHVESVAWISGRKDLLYTLFGIASLCAYLAFINRERNKWSFYLLSLSLFLLSLLSKGMAVAIVALLPLIDYYYGRKLSVIKIWIEKIPFLLLAVVIGLIAVHAQQETKALSFTNYSLYDRILFAGFGIFTYLWKSIVPIGLSCFYDYPDKGTYNWYIVYVLITLALAWLVYKSVKKTKTIVFGTLFFLFTVILILQIIPVGGAIIAERYTYISYIGLFFLTGQGLHYLHRQSQQKRQLWTAAKIILAIYILSLSYITYNRCFVWKDTLSVWNDALVKYPNCIKGLNGRGDAYNEKGDAFNKTGDAYTAKKFYESAITDLDKALLLKLDYSDAYYNRGLSYYNLGMQVQDTGKNGQLSLKAQGVKWLEQSINDNTMAIKYKPDLSQAYYNRSGDYYTLGKFELALADALHARKLGMEIDPEYIKALESGIKTSEK